MDAAEYEHAAGVAIAQLRAYVERSARGDGPATARPPLGALSDVLGLRRWIREGGMDAGAFAEFLATYLDASARLHHPGELAHQVAVPDTPAALADLVHGVINNPMAIYEMGASAAAAEVAVVEWMLEKVGFHGGAGVLTHGGSLANLTALLAARARVAPDAWTDGTPADLALLAPPSAHYSLARAAAIIGLGERAIVPLEVDELERIRPEALGAALERVRAQRRRPLALVAAACATSTGLHDDLRAIGAFCREHGIWLHVDAAHGASALLSPRHRHLLDGIELADSTVWDAHKLLRTSALCAAVLVRRSGDLAAALHQKASYLFYDRDDPEGVDLLSRAIECTKAPLGTKLFLTLAWHGERGLGEYVAGRYDATRRFAALIRERPGFDCPYEPESNILCFSYGDDPGRLVELRDRLLAAGEFHLSSTEVAGRRHLRITVTSPATDERTIRRLLDAIEDAAARAGVRADAGAAPA